MPCAVFLLAMLAFSLSTPWLNAQGPGKPPAFENGHFEAGGFVEYFRLSREDTAVNLLGVGGRFALNIRSHAQIEVEVAGDFGRHFSSPFTAGAATLPVDTRIQSSHILFGPKFSFGSDRLRPFFTIKGGSVNFSVVNTPPANFLSDLGKVTSGGRSYLLYPAVGIEGFRGHWGGRLELGDELYYDGTARSNLRLTIGPQFRF